MSDSKVIQWNGGSRDTASGSTSFILKQSREPYGSIPKTSYAFMEWLIENDYLSRIANNTVSSVTLYDQLKDQFYGSCGGGDGTLLFGVQVVRKNRVALSNANDVKIKATWGYPRLRNTKEVEETIIVDVINEDTITISDYYITKEPILYVFGHPPGIWTYGGVFNSDGDNLTRQSDLLPTDVSLDSTGTLTITFPGKRVGAYELIIEHEFDDYVLTLPPRDLGTGPDIYDETKVYASTVLGFGNGDYANMPLDIPDSTADCIPYAEIYDPETGQIITVIRNSETHLGYDSDGDGILDGGAEVDACICWMCGGTGVLPDCSPSSVIDCTCPNCQGTGILPACQDDTDSTTNNTYYTYNNYGDGYGDDDDDDDAPYTLEVDEHMCTGEVVDYNLKKN